MNEVSRMVTIEDVKEALPSKKGTVTQEVVDMINASMNEPEFQGESLLQTAVTYQKALEGRKASITEYLNALKFCAYMTSMDDNYTEAYKKVFFNREFVKERMNAPTTTNAYKELTSAASRYRSSKLVVDILTFSQAPMHLLYRGYQYKAVEVLHDTMLTAKLDRDKINAAKELLAATKAPENMKIELDVGVKETSLQEELNRQLTEVALQQKALLEKGISLKDAQQIGIKLDKEDIMDAEVVDE
jgi:hypothetical protein